MIGNDGAQAEALKIRLAEAIWALPPEKQAATAESVADDTTDAATVVGFAMLAPPGLEAIIVVLCYITSQRTILLKRKDTYVRPDSAPANGAD